MDEKELSKEFHSTRRSDHTQSILDLVKQVGEQVDSYGLAVDIADRAYLEAYRRGEIPGDFEWPSRRAIRLQREAIAENRPTEISSFHFPENRHLSSSDRRIEEDKIKKASDPTIVLADEPDGTVCIKEQVNDHDMLDGSLTITWLRCKGLDDARRYIQQVGVSFEEPGPGEFDGVYTLRRIYLKLAPDQIEEVMPRAI